MNILQTQPQALAFCLPAAVGLAYCAHCLRRLLRSDATWRSALTLSQTALILGMAAASLSLLVTRAAGPLAELSYTRTTPAVLAVLANLRSTPITQVRAAALLRQAGGFREVSRPNPTPAPPDVTEANAAGTAADKALWLLARLDNRSARLMLGRAGDAPAAWVEWTDDRGEVWLLDPALRTPIPRPSDRRRVPQQAWTVAGPVRPTQPQTNS